jgi:hypothetical protein
MSIALKIIAFAGMIPKVDDRLLPDNASADATNTYFYNGKLEGMCQATFIRNLTNPDAVFTYRIPNLTSDMSQAVDSTWLEFLDVNTNVLKPAILEDQFQRYYWASSNEPPMYNPLARIQAGQNALLLGIPRPAAAPGVSSSGGTGLATSRAYAYTWVSVYGEEGQPSPPTVHNGKVDDTWALTISPPATNDINGTNRLLAFVNIYRTVTGTDGTTTYFFVAQLPVATTTYSDTASDAVVALNNELLSTNWSPPPSNLQGWVSMPNGMVAGWVGNQLWFCEPYRPHAWPTVYQVSTDYDIVGLGVSGQTLVVCTKVNPYWGYGVNPSSFALSKIDTVEPCLSRGSILSAPEGVYYASPNGLIMVQSGVVLNISRKYMLKDNWLNMAKISTLQCARLGTGYYAWGTATFGIFDPGAWNQAWVETADLGGNRSGLLIDPVDPEVLVTQLSNADPTYNTFNDPWTGEVFIIRDGGVYWLNIANLAPIRDVYTWRSKVFQTPAKKNLGALKVFFNVDSTLPTLSPTPVTDQTALQTLQANQWGIVRCYGDGQLIWARELRISGELMRLPSERKCDFYQFEIEARVTVWNLQAAESSRDLVKV